nr:BTB/POZ domain-containing protein POB1-like isoform X2 [Ipomoea batatas]
MQNEKAVDVGSHCEEQVLNCNMLDTEDGPVYENLDEEAVAMVEETPSGTGVMAELPGNNSLSCVDFI